LEDNINKFIIFIASTPRTKTQYLSVLEFIFGTNTSILQIYAIPIHRDDIPFPLHEKKQTIQYSAENADRIVKPERRRRSRSREMQ
jgi:hypothetical protein